MIQEYYEPLLRYKKWLMSNYENHTMHYQKTLDRLDDEMVDARFDGNYEHYHELENQRKEIEKEMRKLKYELVWKPLKRFARETGKERAMNGDTTCPFTTKTNIREFLKGFIDAHQLSWYDIDPLYEFSFPIGANTKFLAYDGVNYWAENFRNPQDERHA